MPLPPAALLLLAGCGRTCDPGRFEDLDADGFGGAPSCDGIARGGDCDDLDPGARPGAPERCDGVDEDCDGWVDDHPDPPRYLDVDGDGFGDPARPLPNCDLWGSDEPTDCDDADPGRNPETLWFFDADGDGVGGPEAGRGCAPLGVRAGGDCDDADPARFPGAPEACDGVDQDCDDGPEGLAAWRFPDLGSRVVVEVEAAGDLPLSLPLAGVDPGSVRVAAQACDGAELPATFLDHASDVLGAGAHADDPLGDGVGALVALWDTDADLATVEPWPRGPVRLGVYWGGPPAPAWTSDLAAGDARLATAGLEATFDAARGGLLDALRLDGALLATQAGAAGGNGLTTAAGPLVFAAAPGEVARLDRSAVTAAVRARVEVSDAAGAVAAELVYRVFAGRRALLVTPRVVATADTTITGRTDRAEPIRPLQVALPGPVGCAADPAARWLVGAGPAGTLAWAWVAPPRWLVTAGCRDDEVWTAANDLANGGAGEGDRGTVPAGVSIADAPVLVLLPGPPDDAGAVDAAREAWLAGVIVSRVD